MTSDETRGSGLRTVLFAMFTVSGFAGLIYEAIWGRYLKLFLGHSAYAQTFVIAIFMGGMALGAWYSGRSSTRWTSLLRGYAYVEIAIGIYALLFQPLFEGAMDISYDLILPALSGGVSVGTFKHILALSLILPPSVLLGMTFPLMSGAVIRLYPNLSGSSLAMLYFTNSIGAAAGVLATGFVLVGILGLPGTIMLAGLINLALGLVVWLMSKTVIETPLDEGLPPTTEEPAAQEAAATNHRTLFWVAGLTGFASFLYEIGWIRMLSMVLGSSSHAFEIMLGTFIMGLAFGGLWIKGRIDQLRAPIPFLATVQIVMGALAVATLFLYNWSFDLMAGLMVGLTRTAEGYLIFNLGSNVIAIVIMLPAAFCAGMTLPLITNTLLHQGHGEQAIGKVYAANTVGAILGVFTATHLGLPFLGLKGLVIFGALVDILLGVGLFVYVAQSWRPPSVWVSAIAGALILAGALFGAQFDPLRMASGTYRNGRMMTSADYTPVYHADGKTASIDVLRHSNGSLIIATNGKPDASLNRAPNEPPSRDESTQTLLGAIPLAAHPSAKTAAVIGLGSGMTSVALLSSPHLVRLDTIEIETKMVEGARHFSPHNDPVFQDPRSQIVIDDARTYFSATNAKYDIIISEPSNPWVSGVASLFSEEFYRRMERHLNPGGIFAQWVQLYELNPRLMASILGALKTTFPDYTVFAVDNSNILLVARLGGPTGPLSPELFKWEPLRDTLALYRVYNISHLELHRLGNGPVVTPLFSSYEAPRNSDYFPFLDQGAARSRFLRSSSRELVELNEEALPILELLGAPRFDRDWLTHDDIVSNTGQKAFLKRLSQANLARVVAKRVLGDAAEPGPDQLPRDIMPVIERINRQLNACIGDLDHKIDGELYTALFRLARFINHALDAKTAEAVWSDIAGRPCINGLSGKNRHWLTLLTAVGARDAISVLAPAKALLESEDRPGSNAHRYLVEAAMIGYIASGRPQEARAVWDTYAEVLFPEGNRPLSHRLLLAHTVGALPSPAEPQ